MKIDLHCHSRYSHDNYLDPRDVIDQAVRRGLDGVCFTEHFSIEASLPVERLERPDGFYIFRGVEISTVHGHLLVYGLENDRWNRWKRDLYLDTAAVLDAVHRLGGIGVPAHPFRGYDAFGDAVLEMAGLDAIETHNGGTNTQHNKMAQKVAAARNLPSIGGSDCHDKGRVGLAYTFFRNPVRCLRELVQEIKSGRCEGRLAAVVG